VELLTTPALVGSSAKARGLQALALDYDRHPAADRRTEELVALAVATATAAELAAATAAEGKDYRPGDPATAAFRVAGSAERVSQTSLVHDIFGNPYRPVALEPSWLTWDVLALACGASEEEAFDRMPILADALQDAGCDNADILDHCRGSGPHVRGCWVVDLVLGKE
jgi:hypothetical protein